MALAAIMLTFLVGVQPYRRSWASVSPLLAITLTFILGGQPYRRSWASVSPLSAITLTFIIGGQPYRRSGASMSPLSAIMRTLSVGVQPYRRSGASMSPLSAIMLTFVIGVQPYRRCVGSRLLLAPPSASRRLPAPPPRPPGPSQNRALDGPFVALRASGWLVVLLLLLVVLVLLVLVLLHIEIVKRGPTMTPPTPTARPCQISALFEGGFLRSRCSMRMWCPDDIGRDSWGRVVAGTW